MRTILIFIMLTGCCFFSVAQSVVYKSKQYDIELPEQFIRPAKYDSQHHSGYRSIASVDSVGFYFDPFIFNENKEDAVMLFVKYYEKSGINNSESKKILSALYPDPDLDFMTVLRSEDVTYNNISGKLFKVKIEDNNSVGYNLKFYFVGKNGICDINLICDHPEILEQYEKSNFFNKIIQVSHFSMSDIIWDVKFNNLC